MDSSKTNLATTCEPPRKERIGLLAHEKAHRDPPRFEKGQYEINWLSTTIVLFPHLVVLAGLVAGYYPSWTQFGVFMLFWVLNGLGITLGYHRCFAHRAFRAHPLLQWLIALFGGGAFQGSIKWWSRNHRIHHRYIDTDKDPYNAKRGFFYTHWGWMLMKQDYSILGYVDISDLNANKIVRFQHVYYLPFAIVGGIVLPWLMSGLIEGDWIGAYIWAVMAKIAWIHHGTFFINSIAHTNLFGAEQVFSDQHSSHDSWFCALLTLGEGYHNFHHEFAQDYRNGIMWYHFDPTKWAIRAFEMCGLAKGLVRTPKDVILRNRVALAHKKTQQDAETLRSRLSAIDQAVTDDVKTLRWTWADVHRRIEEDNAKLMVVGNYVLDLEKIIPTGKGYTTKSKNITWYNAHPGGRKMLDMFIGKDATEAVSGGVYKHSEGAFNLLAHLRVASLEEQ